jgi:hypothetical protein
MGKLLREFREYQEQLKEGIIPIHHDGHTYTVHRIGPGGKLSDKQHLDTSDEVDDWMHKVHGKFANVQVKQDQTGKVVHYTDDGQKFVPTKKFKESFHAMSESAMPKIDLSDYSDSEMIDTIYSSKSNGNFGTYKKDNANEATITLHNGNVFKVGKENHQYKVTSVKTGKSAVANNVEDAAWELTKKK